MIFIPHSRSLRGLISSSAEAPSSSEERLELYYSWLGAFPNYSTTLVDMDHSEVPGCTVNLFPPNKLLFLAFFSLKHVLLAHSFLKPGPPTLGDVSNG